MFGHLWTVCANIVARHAPFIRGLHVCTIIVINVTDKLVANVIAETLLFCENSENSCLNLIPCSLWTPCLLNTHREKGVFPHAVNDAHAR